MSFVFSGSIILPARTCLLYDSLSVVCYIRKYAPLAIQQEIKYGIPATVILAQAITESHAGKSILAGCANNHFGIKAHKEWEGEIIYHHDESLNEKFRKYHSVSDSYEDHSLFLLSRPRYRSLFRIPHHDYVQWCFGLQETGYASTPDYAVRLIEMIHQYRLDTLTRFNPLDTRVCMIETPVQNNELRYGKPEFPPPSEELVFSGRAFNSKLYTFASFPPRRFRAKSDY